MLANEPIQHLIHDQIKQWFHAYTEISDSHSDLSTPVSTAFLKTYMKIKIFLFQINACICLFCSSRFQHSRSIRFLGKLTCIESALIISPCSRFPISIASLDFPVPVAPKITTKGGITPFPSARCTPRVEAAMMVTPQNASLH